ncbi:MAG: hypothetical protein R6T91_07855 [Bacteroidales bacterium]
MKKPWHTLLMLAAVMLVLGLVSAVIPEQGWQISQNITINFPTLQDILRPEKTEYSDISKIVEQNQDTSLKLAPEIKQQGFDTTRVDADSLRQLTTELEMTEAGQQKLYDFFSKIMNAKSSGEQIRIWHYGDSQIESGRISGFLRERLQQSFGGNGPGLLPMKPVTQKLSWQVEASGDWQRHTLFGRRDTTIPHNRFGPLMSVFRFSPWPNDSMTETSSNQTSYRATSTIKNSFQGYAHAQKYQNAWLYYGNQQHPFFLNILDDNDESVFQDSIFPSGKLFNVFQIPVQENTKAFSLEVSGKNSPDFYGISLESANGVIVDNMPMRGSSGLIFTRSDASFYKQQLDYFGVDLILMQFGVNVVSKEKERDYDYYERWIYSQLQAIKRLSPKTPVIVIGISDMSEKDGTTYKTYNNVIHVRNALKNATQRAGYCFWDLFEAMGGENAMPSWVFAEPPLANTDFTHFNYRGARIISNMFYNALMYEYQKFLTGFAETNE